MSNISELANSIGVAAEQWEKLSATITSPVQGATLPVDLDSFTKWFHSIRDGLRLLEKRPPDPAMLSVHWAGLQSGVNQIVGHMNTAVANGSTWLSQTTSQLLSYLWNLKSSLYWLLPVEDGVVNKNNLKDLAAKSEGVELASQNARKGVELIKENVLFAEKTRSEIEGLRESVVSNERTVAATATNLLTTASTAELEAKKVEGYVNNLNDAEERQRELFAEFDKYREIVEGTLEGASKVALAASFRSRRIWQTIAQGAWAVAFISGIGLLVWFGLNVVPNWSATLVGPTGEFRVTAGGAVAFFLRFFAAAPVIWLTWFSARQYGHCLRLAEDYGFKEAAAHAFVGYRNEMADDPEMVKLLRESAIRNFGADPVRVLMQKEPVTPINDAIERVLEKTSPDKIVDLLKDILASRK